MGTPLLRWKILKAIYSHFGEILDDLSPILVIICNGFSFILKAVFTGFSSISETVSHEIFHLSTVVNKYSSVSDAVSHEFSPVLETAFSEFSRI